MRILVAGYILNLLYRKQTLNYGFLVPSPEEYLYVFFKYSYHVGRRYTSSIRPVHGHSRETVTDVDKPGCRADIINFQA